MAGLNKKAVFFSIISLFIVFLFVLDFQLTAIPEKTQSELSLTNTHVKVLNNVINDLEGRYFERILYIATANALNNMSVNGIVYGNDFSDILKYQIMYGQNYSINSSLNKVASLVKSGLTGINSTQVTIYSYGLVDPWTFKLDAEFKYYFLDANGAASWRGRKDRSVFVNISGLDVVVYDNNLNIRPNRERINSSWHFINESGAPSFIDRINRTSSIYGKCIDGNNCGICYIDNECDDICIALHPSGCGIAPNQYPKRFNMSSNKCACY